MNHITIRLQCVLGAFTPVLSRFQALSQRIVIQGVKGFKETEDSMSDLSHATPPTPPNSPCHCVIA